MQKIESIIEGELLRKLSVTTKPSGTELGHGCEHFNNKFNNSSATMQLEFNNYKKATKEELRELKEQLDDQENRARRQNLRLVSFPEGVKGKSTVAFIQK